jgi:hypothetical protein
VQVNWLSIAVLVLVAGVAGGVLGGLLGPVGLLLAVPAGFLIGFVGSKVLPILEVKYDRD